MNSKRGPQEDELDSLFSRFDQPLTILLPFWLNLRHREGVAQNIRSSGFAPDGLFLLLCLPHNSHWHTGE